MTSFNQYESDDTAEQDAYEAFSNSTAAIDISVVCNAFMVLHKTMDDACVEFEPGAVWEAMIDPYYGIDADYNAHVNTLCAELIPAAIWSEIS